MKAWFLQERWAGSLFVTRVDCSVAEHRPKPCWAEAHEKIARMTLTIKLDRNWSSFQLANSAPPLSVTDSAIAPSARMQHPISAWCSTELLLVNRQSMLRVVVCLKVFWSALGSFSLNTMLPLRVRCPWLCAMPVQRMRVPE